jgi:ankyrin repeat protein
VNAKDDYGRTPLDLAIQFKKPETADLLRKHGGKTGEELKAAKRSLEISIHEAAKTGNIEVVKQRLASGVDVDAVDDEWSMTPLFFAANKGHVQVAEFLISAGADVNAKNRFDRTPLYRAAYWGNKEIAEILIAKGADVNTQPRDGTGTPLDWANQYGRPETANIIRENGGKTKKELKAEGKLVEPSEPVAEAAKPEPPPVKAPDISIHDAVKKGNIEAVKQHIAAGTDVNAKGGVIGGTPLYGAVAFGHKEIVELLIANGADVNEKGVDGITPLDLATAFRHRRAATIDLLRKHGGKHSSILLAAEAGNVEAVKQHLDAGADVNEKDGTGRTPLDWAERGWPRDSPEVIAARKETADLLRKHGGKTSEELKAEGK